MYPMTTEQELTSSVMAAMTATLGTQQHQGPAEEALRLLAILKPIFKELLDRVARSVGSSQVRAAAFISLTEDLYRISGYGQFLAASRATHAQLHTITETPLAELNSILTDPTEFITGKLSLPADAANASNRKPLYRDEAEFLKTQQNLTYFQAAHRVDSAANLLPHTGFNGRPVPPKFPQLGKLLEDGTADPRTIASLAKGLEGMRPVINQHPDPESTARELEAELASAASNRNADGTGKLLKNQAKRLNAAAVEQREEQEAPFAGVYYQGHTRKGYEYKVITNAEGHELLSTAADILGNTRTINAANTRAKNVAKTRFSSKNDPANTTDSSTTHEPSVESGSSTTPPLPIPEWAIDPNTPMDQRPVSGFGDPFTATDSDTDNLLDPGFELLPGETLAQAHVRQRAAHLHQLLLDSIRILTTGKDHGTPRNEYPGEPSRMNPQFNLVVTIDYQTLKGELEQAGFTDHGQDLSAAACRRIACNAGIIPAILNGDGVPLELGRSRRYFNRAQRRAIAVRDKGCCNPGCSMSVNRTEAHHLDEWSAGGKTDVSCGCLLCVRCHTAYHAGHFRIVMINGLPHVIQPKSVDPHQIPRRNWIFHPGAQPLAA